MTSATAAARESYEQVAYEGAAFAQTHPERLATIAALFGMKPAPAEKCRVLELGCTDGGNLIPMAYSLPESTFIGIDLAPSAIARAQADAANLQLQNIEFRALDILDVTEGFGEFDYIIAHGIYSWVPEIVREKMLAILKTHLAPQGVGYISYNAYPGGHFRDLTREMMLFHVRGVTDCAEKAQRARELLNFIIHSKHEPDLYRNIVGAELERISECTDATLYHDDLGDVNAPMYFYKFASDAAERGLQFLAEAEFSSMHDRVAPEVAEMLNRFGGDIVAREQYMDFIKCRRFRQTLLCHDDVPLKRNVDPGLVRQFYIASSCKPKSAEPKLDAATVEEFEGPRNGRMSTDLPLAKAAVLHLGECWPQSLTFSELLSAAQSRLRDAGVATGDESDATALAKIIYSTHTAGLVELHSHAPRFVLAPGKRPVASPIARGQIAHRRQVTNLRHHTVRIEDDIGAHLLKLLDGTRDCVALVRELRANPGASQSDAENPARDFTKLTAEELEQSLANLGRLALLIE